MSPSVRAALTPAVDIIGRIYVKEVMGREEGKKKTIYQRRLLVGPHETYTTGDRSGLMPNILVNPNLTKIINRLKEGV